MPVAADRIAFADPSMSQTLVQRPLCLGDVMEVVGDRSRMLRVGRDVSVAGVLFGSGGELRVDRALHVSGPPERARMGCLIFRRVRLSCLHAACASSTHAAGPASSPAGPSC